MASEQLCEFADGPLQGHPEFQIPREKAPAKLRFPVTKDLKPHHGQEKPAGYVEYEKRQDNGNWKYFHTNTDLSPEAADAAFKQLKDFEVTSVLSVYTIEQLAREIARRGTFASVVVYAIDEATTGSLPAGSDVAVVASSFFTDPVGPAKILQLGLDTLKQQFGLKEDRPPTFEVDGIKTLPLFVCMGKTLEKIGEFDKGKVQLEYVDPTYDPPQYSFDAVGQEVSDDPTAAIRAVKAWNNHLFKFTYFVQFKDDKSRKLIRGLHEHTELVATLCDSRLGLDPTEIWAAFDGLMSFEAVHADYRADPDRSVHYPEYSKKVEYAHNQHSEHSLPAKRLIDRMVKQIELKSSQWKDLPPIVLSATTTTTTTTTPAANLASRPLKLFYSYSSHDEELRVEIEKHLKLLEHSNVIEPWHFRMILPGHEWEDEIDEHLEAAHIILLLISADFLSSNYCWKIEARRALERHHQKLSRVIPVVVRACDWRVSPFAKLQALPKNAKAVTSWPNTDEALTDVAQGIRRAVDEMRSGKL